MKRDHIGFSNCFPQVHDFIRITLLNPIVIFVSSYKRTVIRFQEHNRSLHVVLSNCETIFVSPSRSVDLPVRSSHVNQTNIGNKVRHSPAVLLGGRLGNLSTNAHLGKKHNAVECRRHLWHFYRYAHRGNITQLVGSVSFSG